MTAQPKWIGLLGMARRAGKLSVGFDAAVSAVCEGNSDTLLIAADASPKTEKECRFQTAGRDAVLQRLPLDKAALAAAIGAHKPVAVLAITDAGFAKAIRSHCIETKEEHSL